VTGLDAAQRAALERLVVRARSRLEQDLDAQAEGRYGINSDGTIEDEAALHLDPSALADRREIVAIVEHLRNEGETPTGAVARLIREAAFTHLNRLVAIRVAEAMGLLPSSLVEGRASQGFREVLEVAPLVGGDDTGGYWTYLRLCGDEMARDAPVLFDPRNPLLTLSPSPTALDELVELFADPNLREIWTGSDTFGWTYQFFNTGQERRQMRDAGAPRNSRELAVRNQFFTPRYVVDFLVQNTLGRRLVEAQPHSALVDTLPLLIDPPAATEESLPLNEVRILDPACGSGHFLLGCYDLLERAWELHGVDPADAASLIVPTLWGIDIDPRCAQVASAAIIFRARRHCRELPLPRPNVVTARALPDGSDTWEQVLASLPSDRRELVERMREALAQAPALGPLLKVEKRLDAEIRRHFTGSEVAEGTLAEGIAPDAFGAVESGVLDALQRAADSASSTAAERLLAAEAGDAIRFVDALRQDYDVVLMNPPFGEPVPETREYLRAAYPWLPTKDHNLLAAFVGRGLELARPSGYVGAITSRTGLFLTTFARWRDEVVLRHQLTALADLGLGVMEQALVEAAAYVIGAGASVRDRPVPFIRLLRDTDRPAAIAAAIANDRGGQSDNRVFRTRIEDLEVVPGAPLSYWMAPSIRRLFIEFPGLEESAADVRQGLATGDDFRFVRAFWEVDPRTIGRSRDETRRGLRWAPFVKGGEYQPFWSDVHLLVDWEDDGRRIRETGRAARVQNAQHYFLPGLTWPRRTASGFSPRVMPEGCVFADKGPAALADRTLLPTILGYLTSRLATSVLGSMLAAGDETTSGTASKSYEVGLVQKLPWPEVLAEKTGDSVAEVVGALLRRISARDRWDETTRRFVLPEVLDRTETTLGERITAAVAERYDSDLKVIEESANLERVLHDALGLDKNASAYLDEEAGRHPGSYSADGFDDETRMRRLFTSPIDEVIRELIQERGGSRAIATLTFVADRRLDVLSHGFGCHPSALVEARDRLQLLPPEEPHKSARDLISYLVGAAFGRWDVRIGRAPALAPVPPELFDPVPVCSPGLLVGADGMPALETPPDYPFEIASGGLLLDEPGHRWDIENAIHGVANQLFADPDAVLAEILDILGMPEIRAYLRKQFFKDHLGRYSKSRRKAPLYWYLSVPSRKWGLWVYAPKLSREALFAIAGEAARRDALAAEAIRRLQVERDVGGTARGLRQVSEALAAEETLAGELGTFRAEAERIAGLGWEPDLDDGIILCAAPLASLFPAWPDAGKEREQIRKGEYPWATVSRWKDDL
jgi:hypothetical protein